MRMKILFFVTCMMQLGVQCSRLKVFHPTRFKEYSGADINSSSLQAWNEAVFGLASNNNSRNNVLFDLPKAFVVVSVTGIETLEQIDGENYDVAFNGQFDLGNIDSKFTKQFGKDMQRARIDFRNITGSEIAKIANNITLGKTIGIDDRNLRAALINMYKLSQAIKNRNVSKKNAVDFYRINMEIQKTEENMDQITMEIRTSIQDFYDTVKRSYGDDGVILEIYTCEPPSALSISHIFNNTRVMYNVARFADIDKPATYGIVFLVVIVFSFTVLAAVIHMFDSDMSKNSLVYRLTNVKSKKES